MPTAYLAKYLAQDDSGVPFILVLVPRAGIDRSWHLVARDIAGIVQRCGRYWHLQIICIRSSKASEWICPDAAMTVVLLAALAVQGITGLLIVITVQVWHQPLFADRIRCRWVRHLVLD